MKNRKKKKNFGAHLGFIVLHGEKIVNQNIIIFTLKKKTIRFRTKMFFIKNMNIFIFNQKIYSDLFFSVFIARCDCKLCSVI